MALALHVGPESFEVGTPSFLRSFFSTVFVRLEGSSWGSRFPTIMGQFYSGRLDSRQSAIALAELQGIRQEFEALRVADIVWDHERAQGSPPWGSNISPDIHNLADYFVTSSGKPFLDVLETALKQAQTHPGGISIE